MKITKLGDELSYYRSKVWRASTTAIVYKTAVCFSLPALMSFLLNPSCSELQISRPCLTARGHCSLKSRKTQLNLTLFSSVLAPKSYPGNLILLSCCLSPRLFLPQYDFSTQLARKALHILLFRLSSFPCPPSTSSLVLHPPYCSVFILWLSPRHQVQSSCSQSNPSNSVNLIFWIWSHCWFSPPALHNLNLTLPKSPRTCTSSPLSPITFGTNLMCSVYKVRCNKC